MANQPYPFLKRISGIALALETLTLVQRELTTLAGACLPLAKQNRLLTVQNEHIITQNETIIRTLTHQGETLMAGQAEENAAIQTLTDAVGKYTGDVSAQIKALQSAKDAGQDTQPFIDRLSAVTQAIVGADGELNPGALQSAAAAPVKPPATPAPAPDTTAGVGTTGTAASKAPDATPATPNDAGTTLRP